MQGSNFQLLLSSSSILLQFLQLNAFSISGKVTSLPPWKTFLVIALYYCITLLKSIYRPIIFSGNYQQSCLSLFHFATSIKCYNLLLHFIFRCEEFLRSREHIDLDIAPAQLWEHQWEQFLTEYYSIIQGGAKIQVLWTEKYSQSACE